MTGSEILVLRKSDLPKVVTLIGDHGEQEFYEIKPAGRKFGACLQKVTGLLREKLML